MNQKGSISGFLTSKMAYMIAIILLIISIATFSSRIGRRTEREKMSSVIEKISNIIHKAKYLPGKVRIEEELPQINSSYRLEIRGKRSDAQIITIKILSSENLKEKETLVLDKTARFDNFKISTKNPQKIILKKFEKFYLEVF